MTNDWNTVSATARILTVMTRLGTFTVEDLASRSGVSKATVRTVIRRNPTLFQKVGIKPTGKPGGQLVRYQVDPEHEAELRDALEDIRADLVPADDDPLPAALAADPIWLPLSVSAAEAILLDELPNAPVDQRPDLLHAADEYIGHARLTRQSADDAEPTTPYLAAHLDLLDFIRSVADLEVHGAPGGRVSYAALMARWRELPWGVLNPEASTDVLARLYELMQASVAKEAAKMPVKVVYSESHGVPGLLDRALKRVAAEFGRIQVVPLNAAALVSLELSATAEPRLCVLAFDRASIKDHDPATIIPAVAKIMRPMDELVVASEEMDEEVYGEAVRNGATFLYLDAEEALELTLHRGIERASERFVATTFRSALGVSAAPRQATRVGLAPRAYGTRTSSPMAERSQGHRAGF
jgi:hypothetical protein